MCRWLPHLILLLLCAVLVMQFWSGDGGFLQTKALDQQVSDQNDENARLQQRNDALAAEVEDLKSGEVAVEERARAELGMVKPDETFYRVIESKSAKSTNNTDPSVEPIQ